MQRLTPWIRPLLGWTLAVYWLALFAGTHSPKPPEIIIGGGDKAMHFSGYMGLSFLLALWRMWNQPLTLKRLVTVLAIVIAYGAIDEITQIPVGRDCEFLDWVSDICGASAGAGLAAVGIFAGRRFWPGEKQAPRNSSRGKKKPRGRLRGRKRIR